MSNDGSGTKEPYCTRKKRALEGSTYYTPIIIIIIEWKVPFLSFRFCKREVLSRHWFTQTSHLQLSGNSYIIVCIYIYIYIIPKVKSSHPGFRPAEPKRNATFPGGFPAPLWDLQLWLEGQNDLPTLDVFQGSTSFNPSPLVGASCIVVIWPGDSRVDLCSLERTAWNLMDDAKVGPKWLPPYTFGTGSELFSIALLKHRCMRCICWSYKIYSSQIYKRRVKNTLALCMESRQNLPGMIQLPSKTSFSVTS